MHHLGFDEQFTAVILRKQLFVLDLLLILLQTFQKLTDGKSRRLFGGDTAQHGRGSGACGSC